MTDTANLALPCIEGSQAQKHVTHNEALRLLDTLVQLAVLDRDLTAPPGSPAEGQRWIVKAGATGAWAGHVNAVAAWQDGIWQFSTPRTGWLAYVVDELALLAWNGSAWVTAIGALTSLNNLTLLGVGATADATNPLSAKLNNTLFAAKTVAEGGDGHLRYKLSKESAAKTLSFLFQDNYSGRAEIGLTGDDDFRFKVSADGTTWRDGIVIAAGTGAVTFPNSTIAGGREILAANRTYYVRTDGSNSNNGLANTSGGAFLTIQKALDTVAALDLSIYNVTINVAAGTYTTPIACSGAWVGSGTVTLVGDTTTPGNVILNSTSAGLVLVQYGCLLYLGGFDLRTTTSGTPVRAANGGKIQINGKVKFGALPAGGVHMQVDSGGFIKVSANYEIASGGTYHVLVSDPGSYFLSVANTTTVTGTPAFTNFALVSQLSVANFSSVTFSGSATGARYSVALNGVLNVNGGGASFLPGNAAGSTATGGQYA